MCRRRVSVLLPPELVHSGTCGSTPKSEKGQETLKGKDSRSLIYRNRRRDKMDVSIGEGVVNEGTFERRTGPVKGG